jgi:hypothetical protein
MLNGVNINYVIVLLVCGAVLLAAIYHTILYIHVVLHCWEVTAPICGLPFSTVF